MAHAGAELRDLAVAGAVLALALLVSGFWLAATPSPSTLSSSGGEGFQDGSANLAGGRDRFLDGLRAIAAIAVMASHYGGHVVFALTGAAATPVFHNLGTAGVQVFFALTGYLFTRKAVAAGGALAPRPFLLARLRRIVPMYTLSVALGIALVCLATWREPVAWGPLARQAAALYAFGFVLDGAPRIKSVPYTDVLGAIWSLPFEWLFYLFVPVLAVVVASPRLLAAASLVLAVYFGLLMTDGRGDVFCPFFLPGVLAALVPLWNPPSPCGRGLGGGVPRERGPSRADPSPCPLPQGEGEKPRGLMAVAALLLALAAILPGMQNFTPARLLLMTLLFGAVVLARPALLERRAVVFLGDISYSIYLLHFPVLFAVLAALRALDPSGAAPLGWAATLLGAAAAVVALSAVTWRWVELPFLRRGRRAVPVAAPALV